MQYKKNLSKKIISELDDMIKRQVSRGETEIADLQKMVEIHGAVTARHNSELAELDDIVKKHQCRFYYR